MLAGRAAFEGETVTDILAAVLEREPAWSALRDATPGAIRRLLRRCLEKDPARRLRDIGDARLEIEDVLADQRSTPPSAAHPHAPGFAERKQAGGPGRSRLWGIVAAAVVLTGAATVWSWWPASTHVPPRPPMMRLPVDLGVELSRSQAGPDVGISPNGERLVFMADGRLFTRQLDRSASVALEGTEGATNFFFSPDSKSLAFFTQDKLKRIALDGGAVATICDAPAGRGGSWGEDGVIVAALDKLEGLSRVSAAGGTPQPLTRLAPGEVTHRWPDRLPGGNAVLFTRHHLQAWFDKARIEALGLADGRRKVLVENASFGRFIRAGDGTGYLVFRRGTSLFAAPFDPDRLEIGGSPFPILEQVASSNWFGFASFDTARTGTFVYRVQDQTAVTWLDGSGTSRPLLAEPGVYEAPGLSNDGKRLAIIFGGDLWIHDIGRGTHTRLVVDAAFPLWTPDDRFIVFRSPTGLSWIRSDGGTAPQTLTTSENVQTALSFTADGRRMSLGELDATAREQWNLWTVPVRIDDSGVTASQPEPFLATAFDERAIVFSADGRWVAYSSDESGRREIYVRAFPDEGRKWQISTNGGTYPQFSPHRSELFFQTLDGLIMVAPYSVKPTGFAAERPRVWSNVPIDNSNELPYFAIAPDGKSVAAVVRTVPPERQPNRSVMLWLNALDRFRDLPGTTSAK
jgi:serine/threonine-protein kinase